MSPPSAQSVPLWRHQQKGYLGMFRSDDDPVAMPTARQGPDISVFKGIFGPKGDLDRLIALGGHGAAVVALWIGMDDPEIDLWPDPSGAGSNTGTLGSRQIRSGHPFSGARIFLASRHPLPSAIPAASSRFRSHSTDRLLERYVFIQPKQVEFPDEQRGDQKNDQDDAVQQQRHIRMDHDQSPHMGKQECHRDHPE